MSTATLSSKFQISVPKEVRDALGLVPGQKLAFINTGSAIKLVAQPRVAELVGIGRGANTSGLRERDDRRVASTSGSAATKRAPKPRRSRKAA